LNDGKPFEPEVYPEDWADLEDAEAAALAGPSHRLANLRKAQAVFLGKVLGRLPGAPQGLRLTMLQIGVTMRVVARVCLQTEDPDRPLAQGGGSSAPSPSPA